VVFLPVPFFVSPKIAVEILKITSATIKIWLAKLKIASAKLKIELKIVECAFVIPA
jgi:hypothetical protein